MSNTVLVDTRVLFTELGREYVDSHLVGNPLVKIVYVTPFSHFDGDEWLADNATLIRPSKPIDVEDFDSCYTYYESVFRSFANGFEPVGVIMESFGWQTTLNATGNALRQSAVGNSVPMRLKVVTLEDGTEKIEVF